MSEQDAVFEALVEVATEATQGHMKRNPVRGCIVTRWVCTCGEEREDFDVHVMQVVLSAVFAHREQVIAALSGEEEPTRDDTLGPEPAWVEVIGEWEIVSNEREPTPCATENKEGMIP